MRTLTTLTALVLLLAAAPALAQTRSATAVRACVRKKSGTLRMLLTPAQRCRRRERLITWNASGRAGDAGRQGRGRSLRHRRRSDQLDHRGEHVDPRIIGKVQRVNLHGETKVRLCNIGDVAIDPPAGFITLLTLKP